MVDGAVVTQGIDLEIESGNIDIPITHLVIIACSGRGAWLDIGDDVAIVGERGGEGKNSGCLSTISTIAQRFAIQETGCFGLNGRNNQQGAPQDGVAQKTAYITH